MGKDRFTQQKYDYLHGSEDSLKKGIIRKIKNYLKKLRKGPWYKHRNNDLPD